MSTWEISFSFFLFKENKSVLLHLYERRQTTELHFSLERRVGMSAVSVLLGADLFPNL